MVGSSGTLVPPDAAKMADPEELYRQLMQVIGRDSGMSDWGSAVSHTSFDNDTTFAHTDRNRGTAGGGRHYQALHSSSGASVTRITDAGLLGGVIGEVKWIAGSSVPTGFLACDGSSLLRASYPLLFTAIGTTWGAADGTHFSVPDLRGKLPLGVSGSHALGATGGSESSGAHTHPGSHSHGMNNHVHGLNGHTHGAGGYGYSSSTNTGTDSGGLNFNEGSGANHDAAFDGHVHNVVVSGSVTGTSGGNSGNTDVAGPSTTENDSNAPAASYSSGTSNLPPFATLTPIIFAGV